MASYNPQASYGYSGSAFGTQPGPVPMPQPAKDLAAQFPNLTSTNAALSGDILSQLKGQLSPDTIQSIQDAAATYGTASGMPGSGLVRNIIPRSIGLQSQALQQQGIQNYNQTIPTVSATQTVQPSLQAEINANNATIAASPNPAAAASYAQKLFNQYLAAMNPGPVGFNEEGNAVPGGKYQYGTTDRFGKFSPNTSAFSSGIGLV